MMNDQRLTWIKYFSPNPEQIVVIIPKQIEGLPVKTLTNQWKNHTQPTVIEGRNSRLSFEPLSRYDLEKIQHKRVVYLIQSRESSKKIFKKLNSAGQIPIAEYSIIPGFKNPRWFVPETRDLGPGKMSRMMQPSSLLARSGISLFRVLKLLKLEQLFFSSRLVVVSHKSNFNKTGAKGSIFNFFQDLQKGIKTGVVYTGSYGPLQKFTVELLKNNTPPFAYAKFGQNKFSKQAIQNEIGVLKKLQSLNLTKICVPEMLNFQGLPDELVSQILIVKTLEGGNTVSKISDSIINGLLNLHNETREMSDTTAQSYLLKKIVTLQGQSCSDIDFRYEKMRDEVVCIMKQVVANIDEAFSLPFSLSHGDFTRWNVKEDADKIYVIDWEEAAIRPAGHDLLSFMLTEYLLVSGGSPEKVASLMIKGIRNGVFKSFVKKIPDSDFFPKTIHYLLGISFFFDVFNSNLWHLRMHQKHRYPPKESLNQMLETAWQGCIQLYPLVNKIPDSRGNC